jgi:hypothetical protein
MPVHMPGGRDGRSDKTAVSFNWYTSPAFLDEGVVKQVLIGTLDTLAKQVGT